MRVRDISFTSVNTSRRVYTSIDFQFDNSGHLAEKFFCLYFKYKVFIQMHSHIVWSTSLSSLAALGKFGGVLQIA